MEVDILDLDCSQILLQRYLFHCNGTVVLKQMQSGPYNSSDRIITAHSGVAGAEGGGGGQWWGRLRRQGPRGSKMGGKMTVINEKHCLSELNKF
jgi:hypothetical protein